VLLSRDGLVKVTDFGLAKSVLRRVESQLGQIKGKLAYMAPEQLEGGPLDARADIYSLGVLLYETLSGQHPFGSVDEITLASRLRGREVPPLADRAPHLEPQVVALVQRCMAPEPDQRFESARELGKQIDRTMRELGLGVSDYELADFISRARSEAEARPQAPHPFDQALGMELRKVGGQDAGVSTFVRVPTDERTSSETVRASGKLERSTTLSPVSRSRWPLVVLALVVLAVGAGVVALVRSQDRGGPLATPGPDFGNDSTAVTTSRRPDAAPASRPGPDLIAAPPESKGTLHVRPDPPGGAVYVAGLPRGTAPLSLSGLAPGRPLEVRIEHEGRRTYRQRVTLQPGQELTLQPRLLPAPGAKQTRRYGTLSVNSDPWSYVYIDGVRVRSTPLLRHRLTVGKHLVRLVNPVRKLEAKRRVLIREGRESRLSVELGGK
jgi:serine/threonine-protein kinase